MRDPSKGDPVSPGTTASVETADDAQASAYIEGTAAMHHPEEAPHSIAARRDLPELRSSIRSRITFRVARLHARLNAQAQAMLADLGIGLLEYRILAIIRGMDEPSASDLSRVSDLDKGQLSRKLTLMMEEGLVTTHDHPRDRRQHLLELTAKGLEVYEEAMPRMMERDEYFRRLVGDDDLAAIHRAFDKLDRAAEKRRF